MRTLFNVKRIPLLTRNFIRNFGLDEVTKNLISFILIANLIYTVGRYSQEIHAGGHPYLTGDWLINYEGGYNGRGLFGQIMLWTVDVSGLNLLWTTYVAQALLCILFFSLVISIFRKIKSRLVWAIGLSPLFIMFEFLDTGGAFRKELLGFASITLVAHQIVHRKLSRASLYMSILLFVVFLFSWDTAFCFIPFYIYLFSKLYVNSLVSKSFFHFSSGTLIALGVTSIIRLFYFAQNRPESISDGICLSLVNRGVSSEICGGTISSLTDLEVNILNMIRYLFLEHNFGFYIFPLLLGLLPFLIDGWLARHWKEVLISFVSVFPLFLSGSDYGRWIHIFGTFLTLTWALDKGKDAGSPIFKSTRHLVSRADIHFIFLICSLVYTVSWRIPVVWGSPKDMTLGLAGRILSWFFI